MINRTLFFGLCIIFSLAFFMEFTYGANIHSTQTTIDGELYSTVQGIKFINNDNIDHSGDNGMGGWVIFNVSDMVLPTNSCNETRIINSLGQTVPYQNLGQNIENTTCTFGALVPTQLKQNLTYNIYYNASGASDAGYPTYFYFYDGIESGSSLADDTPYACATTTYPTNQPYAIGGYGYTTTDNNACITRYVNDIGDNFRWTFKVLPQPNCAGADHTYYGISDGAGGQNPDPALGTLNASCTMEQFVAGNGTDLSQLNHTQVEIGCYSSSGCSSRLNYTHEIDLSYAQKTGLNIGSASTGNNNTFDEVYLFNYSVYTYPVMDSYEPADPLNVSTTFFECTGGAGETLVMNFTYWNERTDEQIINHSYFKGTGTTYREGSPQNNVTSSIDVNGTTEVNVCATFIQDIRTNTHIEYGRPEYDTRFYYMFNASLYEGIPYQIKLYMLEIAYGDLTKFTVSDESDNPLEGTILVKIQRYFAGAGNYLTVAMLKGDDEGKDNTYLRWYDTWYRFLVEQDGSLIYTSSAKKISGTDNFIRVPTGTIADTIEKFQNTNAILSFDNSTRNFTAIFSQSEGTPIEGCLKVKRMNYAGETVVCEKCETTVSATLICGVGANNATFVGQFYVIIDEIQKPFATLVVNLGEKLSDTFQLDGIFMALTIFLLLVSVGSFNPPIAIGLGILGIIFAVMMGFLYLGIGTILGLVVLGGFLIFKTRMN